MSVVTPRPPAPPRGDEPPDVEALEALIEEARRRARRRRRLYGASALLIAAAGLIAYFGFGGSTTPEVGEEAAAVAPRVPSQEESKPVRAIGGGLVSAFALDADDNLFAATLDSGVYKSEDGGDSWRALTIPRNASRVDALAIAPGDAQTVYAGTGGGVFRTTDGGATWHGANGDLFEGVSARERDHGLVEGYVFALVVDPRDSRTVYAGTWEQGLLKTTNGGETWQRLRPGVVGPVVLDPQDPETIYVGLVGAFGPGASSGISKSTDGGRTWQPAGLQGTNVDALAVDPRDADILYAGTAEGLLRSSDRGVTWNAAGLQGPISALRIDPENRATLYAAMDAGISKSTDGGATWKRLRAGLEARTGFLALALDPGNAATLYAATGAGVLKSTDSGRSWQVSNSGMNAARIGELAAPTRGAAYALVESQGLFKRSRGGWRSANTGLPTLDLSALAVDPQRPETVYVAEARHIFATTTGGQSWRRLAAPPASETTEISVLVVDPQNASTLYAAMNEWGDYAGNRTAVFKSTDGGASWHALGTGGFAGPEITALVVDPRNPKLLHGAGYGYFRSTDGGATWNSPTVGSSSTRSLALDPSQPKTMYAGTDGGVSKSTDGGATWRELQAGFGTGSVNALAVDPQAGRTIYAGGDDGLFVSTDGGDTWRRHPGELGKRGIEALAIDPTGHTLYVGGIRGGVVEVSLTGR